MALPAGRYGVTKNQLLKIKKLPMNTIKLIEELTEKFNLLGTAAFKNSTSVVTESSDLVESGAVKDIVGWGNKNLCDYNGVNNVVIAQCKNGVTYTFSLTSTGHAGVNLKKNDNSGNLVAELIMSEGRNSVTFTADSDFNLFMNGYGRGGVAFTDDVSDLQLEVGSTATAYEPYHASVDETKADNSVIGTVEDGANPTKSYAVDEFMVRDGAFCQVTAPVTTSSTWTEGSNYTKKSIAEVLQSLMS